MEDPDSRTKPKITGWQRPQNRIYLKVLAIVVAGTFLFSQVTWAGGTNFQYLPSNATPSPQRYYYPQQPKRSLGDIFREIKEEIASFLMPAAYGEPEAWGDLPFNQRPRHEMPVFRPNPYAQGLRVKIGDTTYKAGQPYDNDIDTTYSFKVNNHITQVANSAQDQAPEPDPDLTTEPILEEVASSSAENEPLDVQEHRPDAIRTEMGPEAISNGTSKPPEASQLPPQPIAPPPSSSGNGNDNDSNLSNTNTLLVSETKGITKDDTEEGRLPSSTLTEIPRNNGPPYDEQNQIHAPPSNCAVDVLHELLPGVNPVILAHDLAPYRDQNGQTSLYGIQQVATQHGLTLYGSQLSFEELQNLDQPTIAHLDLGNGLGHYVVVTEATDDTVTYIDNGREKLISSDDFTSQWTGYALTTQSEIGEALSAEEMQTVEGGYWNDDDEDFWYDPWDYIEPDPESAPEPAPDDGDDPPEPATPPATESSTTTETTTHTEIDEWTGEEYTWTVTTTTDANGDVISETKDFGDFEYTVNSNPDGSDEVIAQYSDDSVRVIEHDQDYNNINQIDIDSTQTTKTTPEDIIKIDTSGNDGLSPSDFDNHVDRVIDNGIDPIDTTSPQPDPIRDPLIAGGDYVGETYAGSEGNKIYTATLPKSTIDEGAGTATIDVEANQPYQDIDKGDHAVIKKDFEEGELASGQVATINPTQTTAVTDPDVTEPGDETTLTIDHSGNGGLGSSEFDKHVNRVIDYGTDSVDTTDIKPDPIRDPLIGDGDYVGETYAGSEGDKIYTGSLPKSTIDEGAGTAVTHVEVEQSYQGLEEGNHAVIKKDFEGGELKEEETKVARITPTETTEITVDTDREITYDPLTPTRFDEYKEIVIYNGLENEGGKGYLKAKKVFESDTLNDSSGDNIYIEISRGYQVDIKGRTSFHVEIKYNQDYKGNKAGDRVSKVEPYEYDFRPKPPSQDSPKKPDDDKTPTPIGGGGPPQPPKPVPPQPPKPEPPKPTSLAQPQGLDQGQPISETEQSVIYKLTWQGVDGASIYEVEIADNPSFQSPTQYWTDKTSHELTVDKDKVLYTRVKAWTQKDGDISSPWSQPLEVMLPQGGHPRIGNPPDPILAMVDSDVDLLTGSFVTTYPISVPLGRKGIEPGLVLSYDSSTGNGWCGVGWDLSIGSIQRSTKKGVPKYDDMDTFLLELNGATAELVSIGGSEYKAKIEGGFMKLTFDGTYWEVRDKNGTRYIFGSSGSSRVENGQGIFKWCLDKVIDTHGNYMAISYIQDGGQIYPSQIQYTGNENTGALPKNTVNFVLEDREDTPPSYRSGALMVTAKRLKEIDVKANGERVRKYVLDYTHSSQTNRSLLKSVTLYGSDGTSSLPPVTFSYQDSDTTPGGGETREVSFGSGVSPIAGDFDGDGITDVGVFFNPDTGDWRVALSEEAGFGEIISWLDGFCQGISPKDAYDWKTFIKIDYPLCIVTDDRDHLRIDQDGHWRYWLSSGGAPYGVKNIETGQMWTEGDNFTPFGAINPFPDPNKTANLELHYLGSYGRGPADAAFISDYNSDYIEMCFEDTGASGRAQWYMELRCKDYKGVSTIIGDFNGDGLTDIGAYNQVDGDWQVALSTGEGFASAGTWLSGWASPNKFSYRSFTGDFNGDGLTDVGVLNIDPESESGGNWGIALSNGSSFDPPYDWKSDWGADYEFNPITGDFNGDGLTDVGLHSMKSGNWDIALSHGSSFGLASTWKSDWGRSDKLRVVTGDFNYDGLTDIGLQNRESGDWEVAYSNGTSFGESFTWLSGFTSGNGSLPSVADINGDGLIDAVSFDDSNGTWKASLTQGSFPDLLTKVSNGIGGTTKITYAPSTQYDNTHDDELSDLPFPVQTAGSLTRSDGLGNSYATTYSYSGGLFDPEEREFRGFEYVKVTDPEGNQSETWFHQDDIYKGRPYEGRVSDGSGNLYNKVISTWESSNPYPGHPEINFPHLVSQDSFVYDGDNTFKQTRTTFKYDNYGNITETTNYGEVDGLVDIGQDKSTTHTEYTYDETNWILNKPSHTYTLDNDGTKVSEGWYTYNDKGDLIKEERWLDTGPNPTTEMAYDEYGNLIQVTDARGATTTTTYDTTYHRFPEVITNSLGHTQRSTYDPKTGRILASTDANGNTTTCEYDVFGRRINVIGPNDTPTYPTISYEYDLSSIPNKITKYARAKSGTPDIFAAYIFVDGLGRTIQTRSPAEDPNQQIISDAVTFNSRGLVEAKYLPYFVEAAELPTGFFDGFGDGNYDGWTPIDGTWAVENGELSGIGAGGGVDGWIVYAGDESLSDYIYEVDVIFAEDGQYQTGNAELVVRSTGHWQNEYRIGIWHENSSAYPNRFQIGKYKDGVSVSLTSNLPGALDGNAPSPVPITNPSHVKIKVQDSILELHINDALVYKLEDPDPLTHGRFGLGVIWDWHAHFDNVKVTPINYTAPDPTRPKTTFEYDPLGRTIKATNPDGTSTATQYSDWMATSTDENGHKVRQTRDAYGRVIKVEEFNGGEIYPTTYTYDALGNLVSTTDNQGNTATIQYDTLGRKVSMDDPDMGSWSYQYDAVGNLTSQTDAKGKTIKFEYDVINRVTRKLYPDGSQVLYYYDQYDDGSTQQVVGRLAKVVDRSGTTEFFYDKLGREKKTIKTIDGSSYEVRRSYDTLDRLISVTYPDGELVSYTYNPAGGVEKVVGSQIYVKDVDYNASGQMTHIEYGNGTSTDYEYDTKTLRLSKLSTLNSQLTKLQDFSYQFDDAGNVTSITDQINTATQSFQYDDLNRLTSAQGSYGSISFEYDSIGNMTKKGDTTFTYGENGAGPHAVTSASGGLNLHMAYDANGNMVQKGDQVFEYDPENRLIKVDEAGQVTAFIYDGDGGRVKKITPDGETIYIGSLYEIKSTVDSPQSTVKSIYLGQNRICQVEGDEVYYYHQDHIGSSNVITDSQGNEVALYEYKPYGENSKIDGSFSTDIRFTGKRLDTSTGLYYYGARYYDPELGRFITADSTIQRPYDSQDLNRYSYCRNNPIRYIDPTGHGWFSKVFKKIGKFFKKSWEYIASAALIMTSIATFGATAAITIGIYAGAAFGGITAGIAGGDIGQGILFGTIIGGITGGLTGPLDHVALGLKGIISGAVAEGTLIGAGMGAISGYAGGRGSNRDVLRRAFKGSLHGAVVGGTLGIVSDLAQTGALTQKLIESGIINAKQAQAVKLALAVKPVAAVVSGAVGGTVGGVFSKGDLTAIAGGALLGGALGYISSGVSALVSPIKGHITGNLLDALKGIEGAIRFTAEVSLKAVIRVYGIPFERPVGTVTYDSVRGLDFIPPSEY